MRRVTSPLVSMLLLALSVVVVPLAVTVATPAEAQARDGASVRVHGDRRGLVPGCRKVYTFDYRVRVPVNDWSLEISVINPQGKAIHASAFIGKEDGTSDRRRRNNVRYKFCRQSTTPGRHVIKAKLTYLVPASTPLSEDEDRVKRDRDRFRLTR